MKHAATFALILALLFGCACAPGPGDADAGGQVTVAEAMAAVGAGNLDEFSLRRARKTGFGGADPTLAAQHNLERYADEVLDPALVDGADLVAQAEVVQKFGPRRP